MVSEKAMAELRGLVAKWKREASKLAKLDYLADKSFTFDSCADELDAALDKLSKENG